MDDVIEISTDDVTWTRVRGAALPMRNGRHRVLVIDGWSALAAVQPDRVRLRVNGRIAVTVIWSGPRPSATGFATCEVTLLRRPDPPLDGDAPRAAADDSTTAAASADDDAPLPREHP